jgi:EAL domain-containing protein (putative c-di-GMP-specific phosphodiesterase class I)
MDVVAEGVEEQQQLEILTALNCNFVQGKLLSEPLEPHLASALLRSHLQPLVQSGILWG